MERMVSAQVEGSEITALEQRSPTFLALGTGFVEDNFSTDRGRAGSGMVQAVMQVMGGMVQVVTRAMGSGR